nr:mannose-1-phosphate guanyltransferase alpha-like [Tanacetum cinerariifolium]
MIFDGMGEDSGTPTEPHHTPSSQAQHLPQHDLSSSLYLTETTETIPTETPTEISTLRQYSRRATRIAQSKAFPTAADEPASPLGDDNQGEAFPTVSAESASEFGELVADPVTKELLHYTEKPETFVSDLINCGVYIFTPEIFDVIQDIHTNREDRG